MQPSRILIVGNPAEYSVGHFFDLAAREMGLEVSLLDSRRAYVGPRLMRQLNWVLRGRYPSALRSFSREVQERANELSPSWVVTTGIAPLTVETLKALRSRNIVCLNYLTDDPWNPAHYPPWFFATLPHYDAVHSTRRANLQQLEELGCRSVLYTPFAFCPQVHYPESLQAPAHPDWDVFFAGSGDSDRIPTISALLHAGFSVGLYGPLWERFPETRPYARGFLLPPEMRSLVGKAKVHLGLVRRANRDGHAMRSFELAAMGACMIVEDTQEHREIFGPEGECVYYFSTDGELVDKTRRLLGEDALRKRLSEAVFHRITSGPHTYRDRLARLLEGTIAGRQISQTSQAAAKPC